MLEIRGLNKKLGNFALQHISLQVDHDDYFVLVGPSGSGKSQLLELIAGIKLPDSGTIMLNGRDITSLKMQERRVGLVFQDYAVFPHLTVRQNIEFPLKIQKMASKPMNEVVLQLADETGITSLLDRYPGKLSGGEVQRVAIARTLASKPELLLLDEPLSNIDARLKNDLRRLLRSIHRKGIPVIHVTHDYEDAVALAGKVAVIKDGRLIQIGSAQEVLRHPVSDFVARFAGIRNFFRCSLALNKAEGVACAVIKDQYRIMVSGYENEGEGSVVIPASDIVVSLHRLDSSARNNFKGVITEVIPTANGTEIIADCGIALAALISRTSENEMNLHEGTEVWLSFKASAVRFIKG
jgi:molybdopterin-binding protein